MSIKAMMMSYAIDAKEKRYVVVLDIPGAFLHANMDNNVHKLLEGTVTEMDLHKGKFSGLINSKYFLYITSVMFRCSLKQSNVRRPKMKNYQCIDPPSA